MPRPVRRPFWTTIDRRLVRLYQGDVIEVLDNLPTASVQMVVTSPPYWGLRDYGTDKTLEIGSEKTPEEYVEKMVKVFRAVRRVLRDDGIVWLNLGDCYSSGGSSPHTGLSEFDGRPRGTRSSERGNEVGRAKKGNAMLKPGNLVGIPWRVALALQADGWVLRQEIIWHKPSPMPESVRNRCTKAHEQLFLLTKKGSGYYYDADAIKEKTDKTYTWGEKTSHDHYKSAVGSKTANPKRDPRTDDVQDTAGTRNKRSVWTVASEPYAGAHFATFPRKLITPCVLAGTSAYGACSKCGAPWSRVVEVEKLTRERPNDYVKRTGEKGTGSSCANTVAGVDVKTVGWEPTCTCDTEEVVPCVVLDPFVGSGTTNCVAVVNGRRSIGIDLSEDYLTYNAIPRIEGVLLGIPKYARQVGKVFEALDLGETIG